MIVEVKIVACTWPIELFLFSREIRGIISHVGILYIDIDNLRRIHIKKVT